ncbi:putative low-specificity L-threonine aldolase 1 [Panicum miliaceum]|uniref:Low-specificity L-threonine aldolase 1 n=1 Tax=Panicum miliaceum TaxID=4540 RepID=A0A3L6PXH0_PANMI|nr:putative low-specificity L-threonine aldolase 1 [Panicum miliaceum]
MAARVVDLRADTVTKPTEAMRAAMAAADVRDGDPTARRFEAEMAELMGKEAALFVPSGTMANLVSVLAHCDVRGSEVILGDDSHIHLYENGGIATIGGVHPRPVRSNPDGTMDIDRIVVSGGRCLSVEYADKVGEIARSRGLKLHIDGARIFNASVALGVPVDRLVKAADSVSVCLSKGLGAPVGSVIVGSKAFIDKAKFLRKTLGGGMRQVGVLCAAAHVAVRDTVGKLADDHRRAKSLAEGLNKIEQFIVDSASVETNMVFFDIVDSRISSYKLCQILEKRNVLANPRSLKSVSGIDMILCSQKAVEELLMGGTESEHLADGATKNSYGY